MRVLIALIGLLLSSTLSLAAPLLPPSWAVPGNLLLSFDGGIGGTDTDVVVPERHGVLSGLPIGREWFAMTSSEDLHLSGWEGFNEPNVMVGFLSLGDVLSGGGKGLFGDVQPNGGVYICISGINDADCDRDVSSPSGSYAFKLYLSPETVPMPEPGTAAVVVVGLVWIGLRRRPA